MELAGMQTEFPNTKALSQNRKPKIKPAYLVHVPNSGDEVPIKCHIHPVESQTAPQSCAPEKPSVLGSCLQRLE